MNHEPIRYSSVAPVPPAAAFERFTTRMGAWWPSRNSLLSAPQSRVVIEPWVGGRWFEEAENGEQCTWGRVLVWEPPYRLMLAWQLNVAETSPDHCESQLAFDPALVTEVELRFVELDAHRTLVELEHRNLDRFTLPTDAARILGGESGWPTILRLYSTTEPAPRPRESAHGRSTPA